MTGIFIAVNFALSLFAIFFAIILFVKFSKVQQLEREYKRLIKEAEDTISSYVFEIKEENEAFFTRIANQKKAELRNEGGKEHHIAMQESDISQDDVQSFSENSVDNERMTAFETEFEQMDVYDQLLYLRNKGFSNEEIAKKLNKGKTEIELLWKFRQ